VDEASDLPEDEGELLPLGEQARWSSSLIKRVRRAQCRNGVRRRMSDSGARPVSGGAAGAEDCGGGGLRSWTRSCSRATSCAGWVRLTKLPQYADYLNLKCIINFLDRTDRTN
jgi:hypothetical protein